MRGFCRLICIFLLMLILAVPALGETRALLVACSDFVTQPDLGSAISGNLHMIGSALLGADPALSGLSIEDGTIGTPDALEAAITDAFLEANEEDLSILYLCTHGMLSADDDQAYLLLGNGETESPLSSTALYEMVSVISGEKLLILDACFSGGLIGRGEPAGYRLPGTRQTPAPFESPFAADSSIHVVTSASGSESSWYYDSEGLQTGAVSYFASALSSGLGLYGKIEADINGDGAVSLAELLSHLSAAVPSSSSQLLSSQPDMVFLPTARGAMLSRPLCGFSYGGTLLAADDPTLDFSFTVSRETSVQYRLIEYENGAWNWAQAQTFMDGDAPLSAGRHTRSLTLPTVTAQDSGYLMLQVFSVSDSGLLLCSEHLIAVAPALDAPQMILFAANEFLFAGRGELPIRASIGAPAEITVTVYNEEGSLIRRLSSGRITSPSDDHALYLYWDGRDANGQIVPEGHYTLTAESVSGWKRIKAQTDVFVSSGG